MALRMITNPDGTITIIDASGRTINQPQQPIQTPIQTTTQSTVYGNLEETVGKAGVSGAAAYSIYKSGDPVIRKISELAEEETKKAETIENPALREITKFGIGVGTGVVLPIASTVVYGPAAIVAATRKPEEFIKSVIPATESMTTEIIESAQKNPAGFAGEIVGMVATGKVVSKITGGKTPGKPPKTTDPLLTKTPPLEGTTKSTGMPKTYDTSTEFKDFTSTQKVKLTSDQKLPELGRPKPESFIVRDNPLAGRIVETTQRGLTTPVTRTGKPVSIKPTEPVIPSPIKGEITEPYLKPDVISPQYDIAVSARESGMKFQTEFEKGTPKYKPPTQAIDPLVGEVKRQILEIKPEKILETKPKTKTTHDIVTKVLNQHEKDLIPISIQEAELIYQLEFGIPTKGYKPPTQVRNIATEIAVEQTREMALRKGGIKEVRPTSREIAIREAELIYQLEFGIPTKGYKPPTQVRNIVTEIAVEQTRGMALRKGGRKGGIIEVWPTSREIAIQEAESIYQREFGIPTKGYKPPTQAIDPFVGEVKRQILTEQPRKRSTKPIIYEELETTEIVSTVKSGGKQILEIKPEKQILEIKPEKILETKPKTKTTQDIVTKVLNQHEKDLIPISKRTGKQVVTELTGTIQEQPYKRAGISKPKPASEVIEFMELDLRQPQVSLPAEKPVSKFSLRGAVLSEAGLREAGLREAGLREAGLREAGLREAGLREAGLREAGLLEAGLREAGLREAGLLEAGLREAGLRESNITTTTPKPKPKTKPDIIPDISIDITHRETPTRQTKDTKKSTRKPRRPVLPEYEPPKTKRRKKPRKPRFDLEDEENKKKSKRRKEPRYKGFTVRNPWIGIEFMEKIKWK